MPNPGPRGEPQGPRPQRTTTPRRPPAVHPGVEPRPWACGGREGPRTPLHPNSHSGPGDSSRSRSFESDRPGLCEQLFKGSLLFRALRRRLLKVPSAHLKNILSEEHPSFHP